MLAKTDTMLSRHSRYMKRRFLSSTLKESLWLGALQQPISVPGPSNSNSQKTRKLVAQDGAIDHTTTGTSTLSHLHSTLIPVSLAVRPRSNTAFKPSSFEASSKPTRELPTPYHSATPPGATSTNPEPHLTSSPHKPPIQQLPLHQNPP